MCVFVVLCNCVVVVIHDFVLVCVVFYVFYQYYAYLTIYGFICTFTHFIPHLKYYCRFVTICCTCLSCSHFVFSESMKWKDLTLTYFYMIFFCLFPWKKTHKTRKKYKKIQPKIFIKNTKHWQHILSIKTKVKIVKYIKYTKKLLKT